MWDWTVKSVWEVLQLTCQDFLYYQHMTSYRITFNSGSTTQQAWSYDVLYRCDPHEKKNLNSGLNPTTEEKLSPKWFCPNMRQLVTHILLYDHFLLLQKDLARSRLGLTGRQTLLNPTLAILFLQLFLLLRVYLQLAWLFICQSLKF